MEKLYFSDNIKTYVKKRDYTKDYKSVKILLNKPRKTIIMFMYKSKREADFKNLFHYLVQKLLLPGEISYYIKKEGN